MTISLEQLASREMEFQTTDTRSNLWYDARLGVEDSNALMSNNVMTKSAAEFLVPAGTESEGSGHGAPLDLGALAGKPLLLLLRIERVVEQESLHVSIWGSPDGQNWGTQAIFWFPQKFYSGVTPAALDLKQRPQVKFLQARWETNRWGRGIPRPQFRFSVEIQEA